jgi:NitT/TauT family transport system substrate-binding protein
MTKRTRYGFRALAAAVLVGIVAVSIGGSATASPGGGQQLRAVKVGIIPLEPTAQAMYAKERGFFRKHGLDVEIVVIKDPALTPGAVISRSVHFAALQLGGLALLESQQAPVRVVASGGTYDPAGVKTSAIVAIPSKRIRTARDLVGKLIAIDRANTIAHIGVLKWLKRNGVSKDQVRFTELPFASMLSPLLRGQFDAALIPEPYFTQAQSWGARIVAHPFGAVCSAHCLLTMWAAHKDVDADLAARFRGAIQEASVWANQKRNRPASAKILAKYIAIKPRLLARIRRTTYATRLRTARAQPWIDVYAEFGLIPQRFPAIELVR